MSRSAAGVVVKFLSFANPQPSLHALQHASKRHWNAIIQWMNDSGLAFYFLQKLKSAHATGSVPSFVLSRLESSFAANRRRTGYLSERLQFINSRFAEAGVRFAVLKGFSLVPNFCSDASLRHHGDLDYLVADESLEPACRILIQAGYLSKPCRSSQELAFYRPGRILPSRGDEQYSLDVPESVELHRDIWDGDLLRIPSLTGFVSAERAIIHESDGLAFPALDGPDAFLLQVLHAMVHIFTKWIKVASLFEIAHFLNHRAGDTEFWNAVEQRVGENSTLRELVVIVAELSAKLFAPALPDLIHIWAEQVRPAARTWVDQYAVPWALGEIPVHELRLFPTSKLSVLLHQQYRTALQKSTDGKPAPSAWRFSWIAFDLKTNPSLLLDRAWWRKQRLPRRCTYHALAYLRYLCALPRWLWLTRARSRPSPSHAASGAQNAYNASASQQP